MRRATERELLRVVVVVLEERIAVVIVAVAATEVLVIIAATKVQRLELLPGLDKQLGGPLRESKHGKQREDQATHVRTPWHQQQPQCTSIGAPTAIFACESLASGRFCALAT